MDKHNVEKNHKFTHAISSFGLEMKWSTIKLDVSLAFDLSVSLFCQYNWDVFFLLGITCSISWVKLFNFKEAINI